MTLKLGQDNFSQFEKSALAIHYRLHTHDDDKVQSHDTHQVVR